MTRPLHAPFLKSCGEQSFWMEAQLEIVNTLHPLATILGFYDLTFDAIKKVSQSFVGFLVSLHNDKAYILKLNLRIGLG